MNLGDALYVELMDINIAATAGSCVLTGAAVDDGNVRVIGYVNPY